VALPGRPDQPVQVIDARDLARLVVRLLADERPGAFHAVGPAEPTTLAGLIETCARVAGSQVEIVPVPPDTVPPLFPLIRPDWPTQQRSAARARTAGMPATPLAVTAADVLAWDRERGEPPLWCELPPAQEQRLTTQAVPAKQSVDNLGLIHRLPTDHPSGAEEKTLVSGQAEGARLSRARCGSVWVVQAAGGWAWTV
jgi:2'-hydroxyisoflavone reductase